MLHLISQTLADGAVLAQGWCLHLSDFVAAVGRAAETADISAICVSIPIVELPEVVSTAWVPQTVNDNARTMPYIVNIQRFTQTPPVPLGSAFS